MNEWKAPGKKTIVKCAVNQRQVVIALTGGELVYFEMDPVCILAFHLYLLKLYYYLLIASFVLSMVLIIFRDVKDA